MSGFRSVLKYILHRIKSKRWDAFHSPYLFHLFTDACNDRIQLPLFDAIEKQREMLTSSNEKISRIDFGAGSIVNKNSSKTKLGSIARSSLSLPFQCRFMARLVKCAASETILEFGTSLGISSAYLSSGAPSGKIITVEGDPAIASQAQKMFSKLGLENIELINDKFENFIEHSITKIQSLDLIFIDGNHRKENLLYYYQSVKHAIHDHTIVIIDDIYWSAEMESGWSELINMPEVTQSVDCFHFGLLFFNPDFLDKTHHEIHLPMASLLKK